MRYYLLILLVFITSTQLYAQSTTTKVYGRIVDKTDGSFVIGGTVQLYNIKDSTQSKYAITDVNGIFLFEKVERAFYKLNVKSLGYKPYSKTVRISELEYNFGNVLVEQDTKVLDDLEVTGAVVAMEVKGDTIQYNADAFKVNPDASTMDLVSKMPGIVIDADGVSANGEDIEQVLLDGKKFFGQDPLLSLNTIPAEIVNRIEVYDQQSETSQFTGVDDGNTTKTMNVVTKEDKRNGQFGKIYVGGGTDERYKAGASLNAFKGDQRLTVLGMSNNINEQNFSGEDLAEIGGGGGRGGFRRGNNPLMIGTQDGITQTHAVGLNFTDEWKNKSTFEGSYFFNKTNNTNDQVTSRETFQGDSTQYYNEDNNADTENLNHRFNSRITYNINDNNRLVIRPQISYQDNQSIDYTLGKTTNESGEIVNQTENNYLSNNKAFGIDNQISLIHKFETIGRSISAEIETDYKKTDKENYYEDFQLDSVTQYLTDNENYKLGMTVGYSEPIGTKAQLSISYEASVDNRVSNKNTYIVDPESGNKTFNETLSNNFESRYVTHQPEVSMTYRNFGTFYRAELAYQYIDLNNQQHLPNSGSYQNSYGHLLPMLMSRIELNEGDMFIRYRTSTDIPSISQLQDVLDNSNPLFISLGNPELNPGYTHDLSVRLNLPNPNNNRSFSNFTNVRTTNDYISDATSFAEKDSVYDGGIVVQQGAQISKPINLNGYWRVSNNSTYSILIDKLKSNLNTSLGLTYTRLPGMTNDILNFANTYSTNLKLSLVSNFSENVDFNLYYNISANTVINTLQSETNANYMTQTVGAKSNLIFGNGYVFRNDIYYEKYNGVDSSFDSQYILWNMSVAKKFLKDNRGELELSVFDLLGQNQSFSQSVRSSYVEETRTEVLQQYFMMTFTYQLRHFKK